MNRQTSAQILGLAFPTSAESWWWGGVGDSKPLPSLAGQEIPIFQAIARMRPGEGFMERGISIS